LSVLHRRAGLRRRHLRPDQRLPVHRSMAEVSELIYETCKTYMITQGKFLLILEAFTRSS
jgi:hypothetical protein